MERQYNMTMMKLALSFLLVTAFPAFAEDSGNNQHQRDDSDMTPTAPEDRSPGYDLWLRYADLARPGLAEEYTCIAGGIVVQSGSPQERAAAEELQLAAEQMLDLHLSIHGQPSPNAIVLGTPETSPFIEQLGWAPELEALGPEGYVLRRVSLDGQKLTVVASEGSNGVVYGAFHLVRLMQLGQDISRIDLARRPANALRMLNHWDNADRSVERGYAGLSIWDWQELPGEVSPRYRDYARACASIGINGISLNNVNTQYDFLTAEWLDKVAVIADELRPYGIKAYLSPRFSAPMELGRLETADPLDQRVAQWWAEKAEEIYARIPDFGGFLVKANSEGQPGPQDYGRTHADGANTMARALAPHGGLIIWRAFVYSSTEADRIKQAYEAFKPLDGAFDDNVLVQVKNGPLDFQPREPFSPIFGGLWATRLLLELQITQEYLGHANHLVYLGPQWEEVLQADTYAFGAGSKVAEAASGALFDRKLGGMAGVANAGSAGNWTNHLFGQANWYAYGRLAWNPDLTAASIAREWAFLAFGPDQTAVEAVVPLMMDSWRAFEDYTAPLGLGITAGGGGNAEEGGHYQPAPAMRARYHGSSESGAGYDRTRDAGSGGVDQYRPPLRDIYNDPETTPLGLLLWFHHLPYDHVLPTGRTLIHELYARLTGGAQYASFMLERWLELNGHVDEPRWLGVAEKLYTQSEHARYYSGVMLDYFEGLSGVEAPAPPAPPYPLSEVEKGAFEGSVEDVIPGFTGSGYVRFGEAPLRLERQVQVNESGIYLVLVKYAIFDNQPQVDLLLNGERRAVLDLSDPAATGPAAEETRIWRTAGTIAALGPHSYDLRIEGPSSPGLCIDHIALAPLFSPSKE
jgi:alpha-glucuronidase